MLTVEHYELIRRKVLIEGLSQRTTAKELGHSRKTAAKALAYWIPSGYRLSKPQPHPVLDPVKGIRAGTDASTGSKVLDAITQFENDARTFRLMIVRYIHTNRCSAMPSPFGLLWERWTAIRRTEALLSRHWKG